MVFAMSGVAGATAAAGTTAPEDEATATLQVIEPNVTVKRADKENFRPGREGQRLRVGDTVKTDATGFAQVNYTDESFTRLDVSTTFTIVSLTDDEGNRQIKGSVDSGQTWNRTSALTESESFEQEGAGATAAVTGTAFVVSCTTPTNCTFTSVVDGITLTTVDGEIQHLDPLMECDSDEVVVDEDADLCGAPAQVTLDAILANAWILENLFIDGANGFEGIIVVEDGVVVSVTPTPPADEEEETPPPDLSDPPVVDPNPVNILTADSDTDSPTYPTGPGDVVISQDEWTGDNRVTFTLQVTNPGHSFVVVFTALPDVLFGQLLDSSLNAVNTTTEYLITEVYTFAPVQIEANCANGDDFDECFNTGDFPTLVTEGPVDGSVQWSDSFTFKAVNDEGDESVETTVTLTAVDDMCTTNEEGHDNDAVDAVPSCIGGD